MQGPWKILGKYWWAMKHFWKILMGHKKFSYVLHFFFFFFFGNLSNLIWEVMEVWAQKVHTSHQGDFEKSKKFFKISKIRLVMWEILVKIIIEYFLMCFDPAAMVFFIMMEQRINTFVTNFLEDSLFVWLHLYRDNLDW